MWRANRLADLLAKSAAVPLRLPRWIFKRVDDMAALVLHHCAKLGVVTNWANAHTVMVREEDGVERQLTVRDSTAERPNWRLRTRKRKASDEPSPPASASCSAASAAVSNAVVNWQAPVAQR
eukprot:7271024-Karenia_brevis.AAC.1